MPNTVLYEDRTHRNMLLEDFGLGGLAVQANQLMVHGNSGMVLDPGGHKVYAKVLAETYSILGAAKLDYIFLSHQDPDIVAALNGWLMTTDADAYVSTLWMRFVPHFGVDDFVAHRLKPIPDQGMVFDLNGARLVALPAHFLHSEGNIQLYDTVAKILYTGDLGASLGADYVEVTDFDAHRPLHGRLPPALHVFQQGDEGVGRHGPAVGHRDHRAPAWRLFQGQGDGQPVHRLVRRPGMRRGSDYTHVQGAGGVSGATSQQCLPGGTVDRRE